MVSQFLYGLERLILLEGEEALNLLLSLHVSKAPLLLNILIHDLALQNFVPVGILSGLDSFSSFKVRSDLFSLTEARTGGSHLSSVYQRYFLLNL